MKLPRDMDAGQLMQTTLYRLADIVEEAVYKEFEAISERGGVLGAMDTMYQRGKIQEESMFYGEFDQGRKNTTAACR